MNKYKILNVGISSGSYSDFLEKIISMARGKNNGYICLANVHMVIEAYNDPGYLDVIEGAELVAPDGQPLSLMMKLLHGVNQSRVAGMDLLPDLIRRAEEENIPVLFYGSTPSVLEKVAKKLNAGYPNLKVAGLISPPFGGISKGMLEEHIKEMNKGEPVIVFVALGCPKQEKLMAEISGRVKNVMIGIGAAASVFAGEIRRAPVWMQRLSLEWLFRLIQEPKRLWKRYLYTNTKFIFLSIKELFRIKIFKK